MESTLIQIRDFGNGTWSVMARVQNPQKEFYEHPSYVNLTKEKAQECCNKVSKNPPSKDTIIKDWRYIGS